MDNKETLFSKSLTVIIIFTAVIGAIDPFMKAILNKDILLLALLLMFLAGIAYVKWVYRRSHDKKEIELKEKKHFQGITSPEKIKNPWRRDEEKNALVKLITTSVEGACKTKLHRPVIVVGESGSGKSVLLQREIKEYFEVNDGYKVEILQTYRTVRYDLANFIRQAFNGFNRQAFEDTAEIKGIEESPNKLLLILDQFEQFISLDQRHSDSKGKGQKTHEWLCNFISNAMHTGKIFVIIATRKQWYYDIRQLFAGTVPISYDEFPVGGMQCSIREKDGSMFMQGLSNNLFKVIGNEKSTKRIVDELSTDNGKTLPAELQVVGLVLENIQKIHGDIDKDVYNEEVKGKSNLVRRYFNSYVDNSDAPEITAKVLFALSTKTELRERLRVSKIAKICHEKETDVKKCLVYLKEHGLVQSYENENEFELSHDFLAHQYREVSGMDLDQRERDNIIYYTDAYATNSKDGLSFSEHQKEQWTKWDVFLLIPILIFAARLLANLPLTFLKGLFSWVPYGTFPSTPWSEALMIPIILTHIAWAIYVRDFHHYFLSTHKDSYTGLVITFLFRLSGCICNILAVLYPFYWLSFIGIGGVSIGLKHIHLAYRHKSCRITYDFFRNLGLNAVGYMGQFVLFGYVLAEFAQSYSPSHSGFIIYSFISMIVSILMCIIVVKTYPHHTSRSAASVMQGLCDRVIRESQPRSNAAS